MLAPIVLAVLLAHAPVTAQASATQQPPASPVQTTDEKLWPPAGVVRADASGVTTPRLIKETRPYFRANVTGTVELEAVVLTDGTVGEVRVVRSLDKKYGMDEEALKTVKGWRFEPGKKDGVAVPVLVVVEMTFTTGLPKLTFWANVPKFF